MLIGLIYFCQQIKNLVLTHQTYMQRCIQLAKLGANSVAPNPMVGAVLVYDSCIIGEGFHQQYGKAHAEVNCINSVSQENESKIAGATLYVSLEPCNHFGKTPPCSHLIVEKKIKKVVIGCRDSFSLVNGAGVEYLKKYGVDVIENILQQECINLNKKFFTFHNQKRPYIILKFAQTANGIIGNLGNERLMISNSFTNTKSHIWRSEEAAILVGTNTALKDNPSLTSRNKFAKNPVRLLIDKQLKVPLHFNLFNKDAKTVVFNVVKNSSSNNVEFVKVNETMMLQQILTYCYNNNLQSLMVEGGNNLLQSFISAELWDEARVITNCNLFVQEGIKAPIFAGIEIAKEQILTDTVQYYTRKE